MSGLLWLLLACHHREPQALPILPPIVFPSLPPAGGIVDGRYQDNVWPFSIEIAPGWQTEIGAVGDALRVRILDPSTGAALEVRAWRPPQTLPIERADCALTFLDKGTYRAAPVPGALVATCTPHQPARPRIMGYYFTIGDSSYHLEQVIPAGQLGLVRDTLTAMVSSFKVE